MAQKAPDALLLRHRIEVLAFLGSEIREQYLVAGKVAGAPSEVEEVDRNLLQTRCQLLGPIILKRSTCCHPGPVLVLTKSNLKGKEHNSEF